MKKIPKSKLLITGLKFACDYYFSSHVKTLSTVYDVEIIPIENILPSYERRTSPLKLLNYILIFYRFVNKRDIGIVITAGPQIGFINVVSSIISKYQSWHWFTGLVWCNKKLPCFSLSYWVDLFILINANNIFADSHWQKSFLREKLFFLSYFINRIKIPHDSSITAVDINLFELTTNRKYYHQRNDNIFRIGFLGRITEEKGLVILPKLSAELNSYSLANIKFIVCGPVDCSIGLPGNISNISFNPIDKLGLNSNDIDLRPYSYSKIDFFNEIDLLILPSKREGFGIVTIEAHAAGIPVICSDIGPLRESVFSFYNGIHCLVYEDYLNGIKLLSNKITYQYFHENCIRSSNRYSENSFQKSLEDVYYC